MEASNPNTLDISYMPSDIREQYRLGVALKYCVKPMMGLVEGKKVAEESLATMRRFYGCGPDKPIALALIDTMGPNRLSTAMTEALMVYAANNQPLMICSGIGLGISSPQTYASVFTIGNASILSSLTLAQLINPGTPVICSGYWMSGDFASPLQPANTVASKRFLAEQRAKDVGILWHSNSLQPANHRVESA